MDELNIKGFFSLLCFSPMPIYSSYVSGNVRDLEVPKILLVASLNLQNNT